MATPSSNNRDEAVKALLKWCKATSPNFFIKDSLVGFKTKPDGNVTAVALKDIPADTALIRVTPELMFSSRDLKKKWRSVFNELESKVRRYTESVDGFLEGGTEAEEPAMTMALAFGLLLELGDPASKWGPYWDSFPPAAQVPNIFDFEGDLSHLEGSPWKAQFEKKRAAMNHVLKEIVPPVLNKFKGKLGVDDVEGTLKRCYGLWQSRQLKDDVHGRKAHYLVPVLDLIDGESDKLSNVIVDDGPGSNAMHIELVLKASRKIEAGEELKQMYDSCSNASYLQWYGYVTDSMVFGNLSHKTFVTTGQLTDTALQHVAASEDSTEVKEVKTALLNRFRGDASLGIRRALELKHSSEVFDEAALVLVTLAKIACHPDLKELKEVLDGLKTLDLKELLAVSGEKLGKDVSTEALAKVAVSTVDAVLAQLPNGGSYLRDMVQLEKGAGSMKEADRVLIKIRMSEKFLLLRMRGAVCKKLGIKDTHERPRLCDNCSAFRGLRACGHCGITPYCSRQCQLIKWREHKKYCSPAGGVISKAA